MKISKIELIEATREARAYLLEIIEDFSSEEILKPTKIGKWCVKDILSHIAGWDKLMRTTMRGQYLRKNNQISLVGRISMRSIQNL